MEVARALQSIIDDFKTLSLIEDLKPDLRQKHYASAIYNLIDSTEHHIILTKAEKQNKLAAEKRSLIEDDARVKAQDRAVMNVIKIILLVVGGLIVARVIFKLVGKIFLHFIYHSVMNKNTESSLGVTTNYGNNYSDDDDSSYMVINSYSSQYNNINSNNRYNDYRTINNNNYGSRPGRNDYKYNHNRFGSTSSGSSSGRDTDSKQSESSNYGNWGSNSNGGSSSSPSSSGFNGGGATSSW